MKAHFSKHTGATLREEQLLLKRIDTIQTNRKIHKYATFIPTEILKLRGLRSQIEEVHQFVGALLYVDITAVTQLIEKSYKVGLGELYNISINLNAYLGAIIEMLRSYGGDVLSILSNDFISLWKVQPEESLYELLHTVVECANTIHALLKIYNTDANIPMRLKTVLSCGNVTMAITGNSKLKQFVMLGDAFQLLKSYTSRSKLGEIVVTGSAWTHMLHERYTVQATKDANYFRILKIIYKSSEIEKKAYFDDKYVAVRRLVEMHYEQRDLLKAQLLSTPQFMTKKCTAEFIKQLPPGLEIVEAMKYWGLEEMRPFINEIVYLQILEGQPVEYLTEVREITAISFKVIPVSLDDTTLISIVNMLLNILVVAVRALRFTINNITINESSININIVLGILLINHQNESSNALRHGYSLQQEFVQIATVKEVSVGISSGIVFCSIVGHPLRREYVIMGRPLAQAQLLAQNYPQKVTCDEKIYNTSRLGSLYFKIIKYRTENDPNSIFEYNETLGITEPIKSTVVLVDRVADYNLISGIIQKDSGCSGICLHGPDMIGKSKLLRYTYENLSARKKGHMFVLVALMPKTCHPYSCVSEIYRKIFDNLIIQNRDVDVCDLPRVLYDFNSGSRNEDVALQKYRILNRFRDIIRVVDGLTVLCIDNIEQIDVMSWEILELTFPAKNLRLLLAGALHACTWHLRQRIEAIPSIKLKEVMPLKVRFIPHLVCCYLNVQAVCITLVQLLRRTCEGNPGYIECCILRLLNNNSLEFKLHDRNKINMSKFYYKNLKQVLKMPSVFPVVDFKKGDHSDVKLTMELIYLDLFDSLTPFQQLVVKTGSVLGTLFGRTLLIIALNYPQENLLSDTIKTLFDEKVFECGSALMTDDRDSDDKICCSCYVDGKWIESEHNRLPRYAYCKLIHFRHRNLRKVAYNSIAENQRRELHILCCDIQEKMQHVCPNCLRNPASYYAFFDTYSEFLKFCDNPFYHPDYFTYAKDSYENIKEAVNVHMMAQPEEGSEENRNIQYDEAYVPISRNFDVSACRCIDMRYVLYQDIIMHASCAKEDEKVIFYKLKFGMIQVWMLDLEGAMQTFEVIRELCLTRMNTKANDNFRKYHMGKASIGLAMCYLMLKNLPAAKNNIILALRQYNIPTLAFNFKQFRILLRRKHLHFKTRKPFVTNHNFFNWELGIAMLICSKIFAIDDCWALASDCLNYSIALIKSANSNITILMDHYCDAIDIFRKAGDKETCERMQKYLIREFHTKYAGNNILYCSAFIDFLQVVILMHLERGQLKVGARLGYRLIHVTDMNQVAAMEVHTLMLIAEVSIYMFSFRDFIDVFNMLARRFSRSKDYISHFKICMLCYNYTGFHVVKFHDILSSVKQCMEKSTQLSEENDVSDVLLMLLINIQLLRRRQYTEAKAWEVSFDFKAAKLGNVENVKIMLSQMEVYLLRLEHARRLGEPIEANSLKKLIEELFTALKAACDHNLMYKPACMCLQAWYYMLKNKKRNAMAELKKAYKFSKKCDNLYYMALITRVKNHWEGGFDYQYNRRPKVSIIKAPTFTYLQFTQFLHPFIID